MPEHIVEVGYTCNEVARLLGKSYWHIHYAHRSGAVPEPPRFNNARVYSRDDVRRLAKYFGIHAPEDCREASCGTFSARFLRASLR